MKKQFRFVLMMCVISMWPAAQAEEVTFVTPAGAKNGSLPVNVKVTFTTSQNSIHITLENFQANPASILQSLATLQFGISSGQHSGSLFSSSGLEVRINSDKTFTSQPTTDTRWALTASGGFLHLGSIDPMHTLIGGPGPDGTYSNAGSSIAGNTRFNPYLGGNAQFNVAVPSVTDASTIDFVNFTFACGPCGITDGIVKGEKVMPPPKPLPPGR